MEAKVSGPTGEGADAKIAPIPEGETESFSLPIGGGYSAGDHRRIISASTYDDVVSWEVHLEPEFNEGSEIG